MLTNIRQKILVIRFSSIGDIILATSPLRTIRKNHPKAQITFLTLNRFVPLLELHSDIDLLLSISAKSSIRELWNFGRYLRRNNYDLIFDLHNSLRSKILKGFLKSISYTIEKPRIKRALLFYFHHNQFESSFSTIDMYHANLGTIRGKKSDKVHPKTKLILSNYEIESARKFLITKNIFDDFIAVIPGAAWKQKQWSEEKYVQLINHLNITVVLIGSIKDKICSNISKYSKKAIDLSGKTSLREAMAIIANAKYIIGSDTGLVHAAEALNKSVYMITGPTSKETGAGIQLSRSKLIEKDLWCRPCSQNGSFPCYRKEQYCMESIDVDDVLYSMEIG